MRKINIVNEDKYKVFKLRERPVYKTSRRKIKSVKIKMLSHDKRYEMRRKKNETFLIDNPNFIQSDGRRTSTGIFSPYFGQDLMNPDSRTYGCECKYLIGAVNEGKTCPICGQTVQKINPDLRIIGYIDIEPNYILTYHGYNYMKKIIKNLPDLLKKVKKIDIKGKTVNDGEPTLIDLYEDYEDKYEAMVGLKKDIVFTSKIPVYSSILRPLIRRGINVTMLDVNKSYQSINILAQDLKNISHINAPTQVLRVLNKIQEEFLEVCKHVNTQLKGKGGVFRKYGVSGRIDYSARIVIKLGVDLEANEIDIPYQVAMVLYEEEITNMIMTLNNIDLARASNIYQLALNYRDEMMVKIIEGLLKRNNGIWAFINRNPTISKHGIEYVRVRKINDDFNNYCMSMPVDILDLMGADFDGDQLSFYAVKDKRFHEIFMRTFCPTYAFIDRATGYFNNGMGLRKDYIAIISSAWDIFKKLDKYTTDPSEFTKRQIYDLNIDMIDQSGEPDDYEKLVKYIDQLY